MANTYNPFTDMTFTYDKCFLCGQELNSENFSEEHIFPKWLLRMFSLWDQELILLNNTRIKYRNLTIPCCKGCNNTSLSVMEADVRRAVVQGFESFAALNEATIIKWLLKIKYGLLFKELSLKLDQSDINSKTIIEKEDLEAYKITFAMLQSIRFETDFSGDSPWSLMRFRMYNEDNEYFGDDYMFPNMFCMRLGEIGLIACFEDNGVNKELFLETYDSFTKIRIHPIQFREICAKVHYKTSLLIKKPSYLLTMPDKEKKMNIMTLGMSGVDSYEWDQKEYAKLLTYHWRTFGMTYDQVYRGDGLVTSFLITDNEGIRKYNSGDLSDFKELES